MKLELGFDLPFERPTVWPAFGDVGLLVSCMPGATLRSGVDERPLRFDFAVKLGPIGAKFSGEGDLIYGDFEGVLSGTGTDRSTASRVKGQAQFRLHEVEGATRVNIEVDFALGGVLAQFGRGGIIKEVAAGIVRQFADNLRHRLEGGTADATPARESDALDAGKLMWGVVRNRFATKDRTDDGGAA